MVRDFNAHSPLWEQTNTTDQKGKVLEDFLSKTNSFLLNDTSPTYLIPVSLKTSSVDLSMCSPTLAPILNWTTLEDTHFSDHYPILIKTTPPIIAPPQDNFNFKKANWPSFTEECKAKLNTKINNKNIDYFTEKLLEITENNIPKISTSPRKNKAWFNEDCAKAVKKKNHMLRIAKANGTPENIKNFKIAQATCRKTCREAKKSSFKKYISKINNKTPMNKVWKMIKKLKGTHKETFKHILREDGSFAETKTDIANEIATTLSKNSSSENYNKIFKQNKKRDEKIELQFSSNNSELYNKKFTTAEIKTCLSELSLTAAGPDKIHNNILTHLPQESIDHLKDIFNNIWEKQLFPDSWRKATIIPIPKPHKDHTNPTNYRPIALTSCLCKLMEKLVNKRLMWYLETENKLSKFQSGFRKGRSTIDQLIRLETFIRNAFIREEHATVIFFDIEKAFDTTWKRGILKDLFNMGLRGNLPNFIKNFLKNRSFQTKVGSEYSNWYPQEEGVPQGSILSPILFDIKINSIMETIKSDTNSTLYVDDFTIAYSSKSKIDCTERHLQQQLTKLELWANQNGFKFSTSKTQIVHFCQKTKCVKQPHLTLYGKKIEVKNQAKFLGVIFDKKLTFLPHLKDLKTRCMKALNAFKILCNPEWGGDSTTLLNLYKSLILSKLDYACQIYGSARPSYLKMLNPIQNQGLRLATGAYRTSPETSLHAETHILPLELRRKQLTLQYVIKISSTPDNPVHRCIFHTPEDIIHKTNIKQKAIKPISLRILPELSNLDFNHRNTEIIKTPKTPNWELSEITVDLDLTSLPKQTTSETSYRKAFNKLTSAKYTDFIKVYTDGSKSDSAVGSASVPITHNIDEESKRLPKEASIFTAEAVALEMALTAIHSSEDTNFAIFSDSLSCLTALKNYDTLDPRIIRLKTLTHSLTLTGKTIIFVWIPGHVGLDGNDMADELAKQSLTSEEIHNIKLPHSDYKPKIKQYLFSKWNADWSKEKQNKLFKIQPTLKKQPPLQLNRKDSVVFTRLRIGHSALTHSYILTQDEKPFCISCNADLTIKHILTECIEFSNTRKKHFKCTDIKNIFDIVEPKKILNFLKEINLYKKI